MKAFCTQILMKADGGYDRSTSMHDTLDDAEKDFHQCMVTAMNKQEYVKVIVLVINEEGEIKFRRVWKRGA